MSKASHLGVMLTIMNDLDIAAIREKREQKRSVAMAHLSYLIADMPSFQKGLGRVPDENTAGYLMSLARHAERITRLARKLSGQYGSEQKTDKMLKAIRNGVVRRT